MAPVTRRAFVKAVGRGSLALVGVERLLAPAVASAQSSYAGRSMTHWSLLNPEGKTTRDIGLREILAKFKEKTGITVQVQTLPWHELGPKLVAATQAGNPPDSCRIVVFNVQMLARADALTGLDPYINKTFTEAQQKDFIVDFLSPCLVDGKKVSLQFEVIAKALYVRRDWLSKAKMKAPKTWAEFVEVGKAFTGNGKWGYMFNGSKAQLNHLEYIFQPLIHGLGGHILSASNKGAFNDEAAVRGYQFLADCVHKHRITPRQVIAMTYDEVSDAFKAGRVGMIVEGSHRYRDIAKAVGEDNLELATLPSDSPSRPSPIAITGWGMCIPRGSKHPDMAWEWIKYNVSPEAQEINARIAGSLPSRKSVMEQPYFRTKEAAYMRWWMDYVAEQREVIINVPTFAQLCEVMVDALQQVLNNPSANIKQILDEAVKRYNQMIQA